ncbi:MAG: bifunctional phosphoribosylaminoimidazolecarboxamide formyltransferase/IMP cyclohydrolase PurH, partial [Ginsengibacter sp.]
MQKKIKSALISVFYKEGLERIVQLLKERDITIYTTGGTQKFIEDLGIPCIAVESLTGYPSILGGRVKTLHPSVFGGILGRRDTESDLLEMREYDIPEIDLVIIDLYPFEETVKNTKEEKLIIEKIDVGGPSMIRAAAKNFESVLVVASKNEYGELERILDTDNAETTANTRKDFASRAFNVCTGYDIAISNYFSNTTEANPFSPNKSVLRYGENPHQEAAFSGNLDELFTKLNGKELSYNNMVDVDAAVSLMNDVRSFLLEEQPDAVAFAIIKHTNVCGISIRKNIAEAFEAALAGDPESAFGGILITSAEV